MGSTLLRLHISVPPLRGGVGVTDVQHFLHLTLFLCRVKFRDPHYPDGFVFKATLLPRAKWAFPLNCLFPFSTFIPGWFNKNNKAPIMLFCSFEWITFRDATLNFSFGVYELSFLLLSQSPSSDMTLLSLRCFYRNIRSSPALICMCVFSRIPSNVLKPEDWDRGGNRGSWRPQLGFNPNRKQVHLDQSSFRALGWVFPLTAGSSRALFSVEKNHSNPLMWWVQTKSQM